MQSFIDHTVADIKARGRQEPRHLRPVRRRRFAVCAALLLKAIGPQVACIFVDNGLLREGETEVVRHTFRDRFKADLHVVDARDRFLSALTGVTDPQEKRKIIGHVFIDVFKDEAPSHPGREVPGPGHALPRRDRERRRRPTARRRRSRCTTTSAGCRRNSASS